MRIVITDDRFGWDDEERAVFGKEAELVTAESSDEDSLIAACAGADALLVNQARVGSRLISSLKNCKVISRYGIGYDNVDVEAAARAGIWVTNVPGYCTEEVAEHALGLLLSCVRAIPARDRQVRLGQWNLNLPVRRMSGRILGIVGFGATGRAFWEKVQGFAFSRILIADPRAGAKIAACRERGCGGMAEEASFDEVIRLADFISFHVPLNEATKHCVNADTIAKMKDGVILINTARGAVIDEGALTIALSTGKIAAAGLDVFEREPLPAGHPLLGISSAVLSDHSAYYSEESVRELKTRTACNALEVLRGGIPQSPVNRPVGKTALNKKEITA